MRLKEMSRSGEATYMRRDPSGDDVGVSDWHRIGVMARGDGGEKGQETRERGLGGEW